MKLLFDENLSKRLPIDFPDHEVYTVREMKWAGISNWSLLNLMLQEKFDALLTFDKHVVGEEDSAYSYFLFRTPLVA